MGSSDGVETKKKNQNGKTPQYVSHILPPDTGRSVAGASPSHATEASRGTYRPGTVAATLVGGEELWLYKTL